MSPPEVTVALFRVPSSIVSVAPPDAFPIVISETVPAVTVISESLPSVAWVTVPSPTVCLPAQV